MEDDPSGSSPQMIDSTGNGYDGVSEGSMTSGDSIAVKIQNGLDFDGTDDAITFADACENIGTGPMTVSQWVSSGATGLDVLGVNVAGCWAAVASSGVFNWRYNSATGNGTTDISTGAQFYCVGQYDGTNRRISINGVNEASTTVSSTTISGDWVSGRYLSGFQFPGTLDELRITTVALSDAWALVEYDNQNAASNWGTVGSWADAGGPTANPK